MNCLLGVLAQFGWTKSALARALAAGLIFLGGWEGLAVAEEYVEYSDVLQRLEAQEARIAELEDRQLEVRRIPAVTVSEFTAAQDDLAGQMRKLQGELDELREAAGKKKDDKPKWYDKINFRGYAQFRINEILYMEPGSAPAQHNGDRSVGANQSFLIRRARVIFSGDVSEHCYVYLQPDFASTPSGGNNEAIYFAQIRDWYADCYLDTTKEYRFRVGQSKVPYGFENMQSSQNRAPLDRSDSLNSAVRNERDLGVFFYYTPEDAQEFFKYVVDEGLKGSGNYGVFGVGVYNGQGGSFAEQNDNLHVVARLALPYEFENGQLAEAGIQAYTGKYTVFSSPISPLGVGPAVRPLNALETGGRPGVLDERIAGSLVWYPQPFGVQCEWNVGRGPALSADETEITDRPLYGGYIMALYRWETDCYGTIFPFARYNRFKGGYKPERNAAFVEIDEFETGIEWQFGKHMEFTAMYTHTNRTNTTPIGTDNTRSYRQFEGDLLRMQFQVNY